MFKYLSDKIKHIIITFRISILMVFTSLFVLGILSLTFFTYYRATSSMLYVANQLMNEITERVNSRLINTIMLTQSETEYSTYLIKSQSLFFQDLKSIATLTYGLMKMRSALLTSVHTADWGDEKGSFIHTVEDNGIITTDIIDRTKSPSTLTSTTYDKSGKLISKKTLIQTSTGKDFFDPRTRPWYIAAKSAKHTVILEPFQGIYTGHKPYWLIPIASPAFENNHLRGVFALLIRVDYFREYIESLNISKNGKIFIVDDTGKLIVFPHLVQVYNPQLKNIREISIPWIVNAFDIYKNNKQEKFNFSYQGNNYIANFKEISNISSHKWFIGIVAPANDFIDTLKRNNILTLLLGFIILLIGIILLSNFTKYIVRPLKRLVNETEQIKNFELDSDIKITSRIKEIGQLLDALNLMKISLRAFKKYIPAGLVRQIINAGEEATVGGARRKIVVLFTDIQNFTSIAEHIEPEEIMSHLCFYLDELSSIIVEEHGTIDKYIGDSIMAFWGAPILNENACQDAARAALRCMTKVDELNTKFDEKGIPPFITRIGLHFGEAIIGNIGSKERINYTAIGDVINMGSRLESLNKIYGTKIIVTDEIYQIIKDQFVLRILDWVTLKGRDTPSHIYELIAEDRSQLEFNIDEYNKYFTAGFHAYQKQKWDESILCFNQCLVVYPNDTIAPIFISRCQNFKINPPAQDWNGVWLMLAK